jgi:hypothetical protein
MAPRTSATLLGTSSLPWFEERVRGAAWTPRRRNREIPRTQLLFSRSSASGVFSWAKFVVSCPTPQGTLPRRLRPVQREFRCCVGICPLAHRFPRTGDIGSANIAYSKALSPRVPRKALQDARFSRPNQPFSYAAGYRTRLRTG